VRHRLLLAPLLVAAVVPAAPARAAAPPVARADSSGEWEAISDRIATSMEALQAPDGSLADYLSPAAQPYAEAMVGYGLLLHGVRRDDHTAIDAGLRALGQTVRPDVRGGPRLDSVFKQLAVAAGYRLAVTHLAGDPVFAAHRAAIEAWLRAIRPVHLTSLDRGTSNKHLVEALADLELLAGGLTGDTPGTVLADRAGTAARVLALIDGRWPALVRSQSRRGPFGPLAVASDAPTHPLAYHALSLAMFGRAIALLGRSATPTARDALARMARGSAVLAAPDGDLAYWGRSQEQSWALALTAAGAGALAADGPAGRRRAERLRDRAARRILSVHGFGPDGVWIVPALRMDAAAGRAAMDDYAANGVYNGLTLVGAEWALADPAGGATGPLGADRGGSWRIGRAGAEFAVSRRGASWFAVRMRGATGTHVGDPRYAFGLMAAKRRTALGWADVVPAAPRALGADDAPGPWLVLRDGTLAEPYGNRLVLGRRGAVVVAGGFRRPSGAVVRRGVRFSYVPTRSGGVALSFPVRHGDSIEVADFRPAGGAAAPVRIRLQAARLARSRALLAAPQVRAGYASATAGETVRVSGRVRVSHAGTLTWAPGGW
jgi:hypothetical protein